MIVARNRTSLDKWIILSFKSLPICQSVDWYVFSAVYFALNTYTAALYEAIAFDENVPVYILGVFTLTLVFGVVLWLGVVSPG